MPIVVNLDVMMAKRKIGLMELAELVNISPANLSILKNGKAKAIRFSTLEGICEALNCQPGTFWNTGKKARRRSQCFVQVCFEDKKK